MRSSNDLTLERLTNLVQGELHLPQMPPLGGSWEPILGITANPALPSCSEEQRRGAVVWITSEDNQEAWWSAQAAFSLGALAVISAHAIPPLDGRASIQAANSDATRGLLHWCAEEQQGLIGLVLTDQRSSDQRTGDQQASGQSLDTDEPIPSDDSSATILSANVPSLLAARWLDVVDQCRDTILELSPSKKDDVLFQSALPHPDFLGIYSLALGENKLPDNIYEILSAIRLNSTPWLKESTSILISPESVPQKSITGSSATVLSPGKNYQEWIRHIRTLL
jgi:hypothetical protein